MKSEGNHQETFSQWMSDYQKLIFKVVCAYERRPSDQEDLFQEIALQVWKSVPKFRGDASESTWIYRIALSLQALVTRDPSWISFLVGIIMLVKGVYTWVLCRQRADQERAYEKAVVASIEKAIFQNHHMATLLRRWLFFFHIPAAVFAVIGLVFFPAGMTPWMCILFVAIVVYSTWRTPRDLRETYGKEQHELEAIRTRLLEIESKQ